MWNMIIYNAATILHLMIISTQVYKKINQLKYQLMFIVGVYMLNA